MDILRDMIIVDIENILDRVCNEYDEFGTHVGYKCSDCEFWSEKNFMCYSYNRKQALALYNEGYRRVAEDEIVIKTSEYVKLLNDFN